MERITDAWDGLDRRERTLAIVAVAVLLLVIIAFALLGGSEEPPVSAEAAANLDAAAIAEGDVPAMVVAETGAKPIAVPAGKAPEGVAGLAVSAGGDADASTFDPNDDPALREANENYHEDPYTEGAYVPPLVSDAVKAAGRDIERVAKTYQDCMQKAASANQDSRHCVNDALKYGVEISKGGLHRNGGLTLSKQSSDGHTVTLTFTVGGECRALDGGRSCDAWTT